MRKSFFGETCFVPGCLSAGYPGCGIRFHPFPKRVARKEMWLKGINVLPKSYYEGAVICNLHFYDSDYDGNNKIFKLKPCAVPHVTKRKLPSDSVDSNLEKAQKNIQRLEVKIEGLSRNGVGSIEKQLLNKICLICLGTDCKMFPLAQYKMQENYLWLTRITGEMYDESKMPQMLCFECLKRLQNVVEFSTKSIIAWTILKELSEENKFDLENIKSINRVANVLKSKLGVTVFEPNHFDLQVVRYEDDVTIHDHDEEKNVINKGYEEIMENDQDANGLCEYLDKKVEFVLLEPEYYIKEDNKVEQIENVDAKSDSERVSGNKDLPIPKIRQNSLGKITPPGPKSKTYSQEFLNMFSVRRITPKEQRDELEKRKNTEHYLNAKHKCHLCYRTFCLETPYKEHMRKHTDVYGEIVCEICNMHYFTRLQLNHHKRSHAHYIECRLCPFTTQSRDAAARHKTSHDGKRYQCEKCSRTFAKPTPFATHKATWHPEDSICHLCGGSYTSFTRLQNHLRLDHREDDKQILLSNPKSNAMFDHKSVVKKEIASTKYTVVSFRTTLPPDSPYCSKCEIRFRDEEALRFHTAVSPIHNDSYKNKERNEGRRRKRIKPIICEQCNHESPSERKYCEHFRQAHPGLAPAQLLSRKTCMCEVCGKTFHCEANLSDHRNSHSDEPLYACTICPGVKYKTKQVLYRHMLNHKRSRRCKVCGKMYASVSTLYKHMMTHTGIKRYSCEQCDKRFYMPSEKRAHIRHCHMGVPWPKKRAKGEPKVWNRGGQFISEADMTADGEIKMA